jgi:hypothetical protein
MTRTTEQREEAVERLNEIRDELSELADEAYRIVRELSPNRADAAKAYWYAQLVMAISDDHDYLGSGSHTLQDSIDELDEADEFSEVDECDGCEKTDRVHVDTGLCRRCHEEMIDEAEESVHEMNPE